MGDIAYETTNVSIYDEFTGTATSVFQNRTIPISSTHSPLFVRGIISNDAGTNVAVTANNELRVSGTISTQTGLIITGNNFNQFASSIAPGGGAFVGGTITVLTTTVPSGTSLYLERWYSNTAALTGATNLQVSGSGTVSRYNFQAAAPIFQMVFGINSPLAINGNATITVTWEDVANKEVNTQLNGFFVNGTLF